MAKLDSIYTSVAVNASPQCLDFSDSTGLVAFGASHAVVLVRSQLTTVFDTLVGHQDRVNCVKWIRDGNLKEKKRSSAGAELVSASRDKTVRLSTPDSSSPSPSSYVCSLRLCTKDTSYICLKRKKQ